MISAAPADPDLVGFFQIGSSPLQAGGNVLTTAIEGQVTQKNGSLKTFTDRDRIRFTVQL